MENVQIHNVYSVLYRSNELENVYVPLPTIAKTGAS